MIPELNKVPVVVFEKFFAKEDHGIAWGHDS